MNPVLDKIVVKPIVEETNSPIKIPGQFEKRPSKGKVIAAGPGTKEEPMSVLVDETILFEPLAGREASINGEVYLIIREADVLVRF